MTIPPPYHRCDNNAHNSKQSREYDIAAIVVTHNKKDCIINCLNALFCQTLLPDSVYIVDNHSSDGTPEILLANQYISQLPNLSSGEDASILNKMLIKGKIIRIKYVYKLKNSGGAGGFYTGMKLAYDDGYEWFYMMDDDGIPSERALEELYFNSLKYHLAFANSVVINIEDRRTLAFGLDWRSGGLEGRNDIDEFRGADIVRNTINPFNGSFIKRAVPQKIGFVKKEMFIWGDEVEYQLRTQRNGFHIATVLKSIHYHPKSQTLMHPVFPFLSKRKVAVKPQKFASIFYRNYGYIGYTYYARNVFVKICAWYSFYFIFRLNVIGLFKFLIATFNGARNKFPVA
jgi:GT2 family glycosyltransferase